MGQGRVLIYMAKDPAFIFYTSDFVIGTQFMNNEQVGKYIRLMCAQHQHGHLSKEHMIHICLTYDKQVFDKFAQDSEGLFFNKRLENEILKRKNFCDSRRNNKIGKSKNICKSYVKHMENENENENTIAILNTIQERKKEFAIKVSLFKNYENSMLMDFCDYWCEHNEDAKKMRFEMEKVFDISRRLRTWEKNNNKFNKNNNGKQQRDRSDIWKEFAKIDGNIPK